MTGELRLALALCAACLAGFVLLFRLTERGRSGLALSMLALAGAVLVVLLFLAARAPGPLGRDLLILGWTVAAPGLLGALAGGALGRAIDSRRDRASLRRNR